MGITVRVNFLRKTLLLMPLMLMIFFIYTSIPVHAEQEGDFTYTISNGEATVTGYSWVGGDVSIPDTLGGVPVTSIGEKAFYWGGTWWPNKSDIIKSIHIPSSVTHIGNNAFYNNSGLKSINLPQGIRSIDDYTFYGCRSLTTLDIPQSVESIGNYAFYYCNSLTNISIPINTNSIGEHSFDYCSSLDNIMIPPNITYIGYSAFARCYGLGTFIVDESNTKYSSRDGVLFDKSGTVLVAWPWQRTEISIPEGVTSIGDGVFCCMTGLTSITIPEGVTRIGTGAFQACTELKSVILPGSLKEIGNMTFVSCRSLISINLPEGLINIGESAFSDDTNLRSLNIPESVTSIGMGAFSGCSTLENINLPEGLPCIGDATFSQCKNLTDINIPESVTSIGSGAFSNCNSLKTVVIPKNVRDISSNAFNACWNLTSISMPEGLMSIGDRAFNQCYKLTTIIIPQTVSSIGEGAFSQCSGLTQLVIPEKVQTVGVMAFEWCNNLKSIRFNSSATQIKVHWLGWYSTIPKSVTIIGYEDSEAHKYADSYGNKFVVIGSEEDDATMGIIPQGMMGIVVKDYETKQPVPNVSVSFAGKNVTTDSKGLATIETTETGYQLLSLSSSGYCDYQTNLQIALGKADVFYLRKDSDSANPYISMINLNDGGTYYDLFREEKDYNQITSDSDITEEDKSVVEMKASWKGKTPEKYMLTQDGKTIMESTTGVFDKTAMGRIFKPGYKIYAIVEAADGTVSRADDINLQIISPMLHGEVMGTTSKDFKWNKKMVATIPSNLPVFGGKEVSFDIDKFPAMVQIEKDRFRIGIGVSEGLNTKENWDAFEKKFEDTTRKYNSLKEVTEAFGTKKLKMGMFSTGKFSPEVDTIGYIEGVIENGQFVITKGSVLVKADAKYVQQFQFMVGPVPIYAECGGGVKVEGSLKIVKYDPQIFGLITDTEFKASLVGELGLGVGVANVITVGGSGQGDLTILTRPQDDYGKISLNGYMYLKATALFFESKTEIAKGSWTIWESYGGVRSTSSESMDANAMGSVNIYDTAQYSLMSRDYLGNPTGWSGGGGISTESIDYSNQTLNVLQTNIYPDAQPKITAVGDKQVMIWLADNPERTSANRTMLVYSVQDKNTGVWSPPAAVADDGTADFYPRIGCDGTSLYVTWQNSRTTFTDDVTLSDVARAGEITVAKFDPATGAFTGVTTLTDNNTLDTQPQIAVSGDKVGVIWSGNDQNDLFGVTGRNSLFAAQLSGGAWSAPQAVLTDQNAIPSLSAGYVNNTLTAAYTIDGDNDLNTITDRDLYTLGVGQSAVRLTSDEVLDSNPVFAGFNGTDSLFWYHDGNIDYVPTASLNAAPSTIFDQKKEGFSDGFTVVNNAAGKTAAIWTQTRDEKTEIYGALYDDTTGTWSQDIQISNAGSRIQFPSGIFDNEGNFNIAFNRLTVSEGSLEQSDLCTLKVVPSYNLTISEPCFEDAKIIPDTALPVEIEVTNNGALAVDQIKVEVMDGAAVNNTQTLTENIRPGETKTITAQMNLPDTITKKDYAIKVTPATGDEYDLSDNQKTITLGYTDLALSLQKYNLGEDGGIVIKAQLENLSYVPTDATLTVTEDTADGKVLYTKTLTAVKQEENQFVTFNLDPKTLSFAGDIKQIYVSVTASGEEASTGDNSDFIVLDNPANTAATLDSIAITNPAAKLNYQLGESLDLTGLVVTGTYSDGATKVETVTADNISGFDSSKAAKDQVLTITINGKTANYTVQVIDSNEQTLGDVDGNGSVTAYDALMSLQIATGKKTGTLVEITAADVDKSGSVSAYDALKILQYATGKIRDFN